MSVRRIKANKAVIEGDYVLIEDYSYRRYAVFLCLLVGVMAFANHFTPLVIGSVIGLVCSITILPGKVIRQIPRVDVIEIKHYPSDHRVTVVLDDERTKRRQPVSVKK